MNPRRLRTSRDASHEAVTLRTLTETPPIDVRRSAADFPRAVEALIFDVDGTLYRQGPIRRAMLWRLLRAHRRRPRQALRVVRVLRTYRRAQELLRSSPPPSVDLAEAQVRLAADRLGMPAETVAACVSRWFEREPLDLLVRAQRPGARRFLEAARRRGYRLAAFSDYPAGTKLRVMGLHEVFEVVVSAQDPEVGAFKPSPRGLLVTLGRLGVRGDHAVYVGDRVDVDVPAACEAGMTCAIVGGPRTRRLQGVALAARGYAELHGVFCRD